MFTHPKSFWEKKVFTQPEYSLYDLGIESSRLIKHSRVKGLVVNLYKYKGGLATTQTIRDILRQWKKAGKPVWIYANSYSFSQYYLASVADKIFLTRGGTLNTLGVSFSVSFYKDYLESIGISAQVAQVTPYKAAFNSFVYDDIPEEQRKNLEWLRDNIFDEFVVAISEFRNKSKEEVVKMIDNSPLTDTLALENEWIDGIVSPDEITQKIEEKFGKSSVIVDYQETINRLSIIKQKKSNIAVIDVKGIIVDGKSKDDPVKLPIPLFGEPNTGDLTINESIRNIRKQKSIKGAILFVDSGGGSATSSESMLQELGKLNQEIPIVVYFHDVAASGGYYIAMKSDYIFAQPLTITGSIGVISAKISTDGFYKKRKINRIIVQRGKNANLTNTAGSWDDEQRRVIERSIFRIYDIFKSNVSEKRKINLEEVDKIAGGRIWTGKQAKELNLIDEEGNFFDAVVKVAELAKIKSPVVSFQKRENKSTPPLSNPSTRLIEKIRSMANKSQLILPFIIEFDF